MEIAGVEGRSSKGKLGWKVDGGEGCSSKGKFEWMKVDGGEGRLFMGFLIATQLSHMLADFNKKVFCLFFEWFKKKGAVCQFLLVFLMFIIVGWAATEILSKGVNILLCTMALVVGLLVVPAPCKNDNLLIARRLIMEIITTVPVLPFVAVMFIFSSVPVNTVIMAWFFVVALRMSIVPLLRYTLSLIVILFVFIHRRIKKLKDILFNAMARPHKEEEELSMETEKATLTLLDEDKALDMEVSENTFSPQAKDGKGIIGKAQILTRKKDFLHLILSYPMKPEPDEDLFNPVFLRRRFSHMNQLRRVIKALLLDDISEEHEHELEEKMIFLIREVERMLDRYDFHVVAYLPQEADVITARSEKSLTNRIKVGLMSQTLGKFAAPDEMLELAIDSAIRQVSKCFQDGIFRKIGISGSGREEVAKALKDISMIRAKCSIVLCFSVSRHHSAKEVRQNIAKQIARFHQIDDILIFEEQLLQFPPDDFLLLVDCLDGPIDNLYDLKIPDHGFVVLTTQSQKVYEIMDVDLEIRMEDHLLPWNLFCRNVGSSVVLSSSAIQQMAIRLVKECHGHLLAIVLLARALKDVTDIGVWELALHQLTSQSSEVMVYVLKLVWDQKDIITKHCIKFCAQNSGFRDSPITNWVSNSLVGKREEGEAIFEDLVDSFLLENVGVNEVRMRKETKNVLQKYFIPYLPSLYLKQGGLGLVETPKIEEWNNAREIYLMDNKLSKLPENPKCPILTKLWLQKNYDLMEIPRLFFEDMPLLHLLDLSYTSIKSLPPSISMLVLLHTFRLKGCELLMELPPQIGELGKLEEFDLEGTELMYLPNEIGQLISLKCFRVSFCGCANRYKEFKQMDSIIPTKVLSKLSELNELSIDVNPDADQWDVDVWDANVKEILNELSSLQKLKILRLYLPSVESLQQLRWNNKQVMYPDLSQFGFTVGHHPWRIIFRLPHEVEELFKKWEKSKKCLKYINGEGKPIGITESLQHASVFFLDRHYTAKTLSEFGNENMVQLKFCLLVECNEFQTIIDGDSEYRWGVDNKPVFGQLQYLGIHYMKNLRSIWKGQIDKGCLSNLRYLALHTCPNLITIFTPNLLGNLVKLEELVVEDCFKVRSLVSQELSDFKSSGYVLQNLKKMSLLDLPELVTISGGLSIGPVLESLIVYNCPKLKSFHAMEVSGDNLKIKGEKEWWDALKWRNKTCPAYKEFEIDEDSMGPLAKDIYSH
ncbi:Disease resistance protein [Camellia lanceoleosa]|uniref:Disease resistance protein n=1 Tax=Camellia lanceoleosa TaxID=1840588 RepID=A0ACC0ISQ9_9ERIC|nr:Disease resistance protein [Camellia lanceoleosa]